MEGAACDLCTLPVQGSTPSTVGDAVFCSPACRALWIEYRSEVEAQRRRALHDQFVATLKAHCTANPR